MLIERGGRIVTREDINMPNCDFPPLKAWSVAKRSVDILPCVQISWLSCTASSTRRWGAEISDKA